MKRLIFVFSLLSFAGGKIYAQKAYTYVRQNGTKLEKLGTAAFDVAAQSYPRVQFVDGKAVMSIGDTRVAALPMADGGELVVSYTTDVAEADLNKVSKKPTEQKPFATIYSPFQLVVPPGSEVYAPVFYPDKMLLHFADDQRVAEGGIVPVETPLVIHGTSPVEFTFSATDPTCGLKSALSGSSLKIDTPLMPPSSPSVSARQGRTRESLASSAIRGRASTREGASCSSQKKRCRTSTLSPSPLSLMSRA